MGRTRVPFRGKWVKADNVHRGDPIVYTPREWQRRASEIRSRSLLWNWIVFPPVMICTCFITFGLLGGLTDTFWLLWAVFYSLGWCSSNTVLELWQRRKELASSNYTGLFQYGVQWRLTGNNAHFFLPYSEMVEYRMRRKLLVGDVIEFRIRGFKRPWVDGVLPRILNAGGLEELRRRVDGSAGRFEAPKLVLYDDRSPIIATSPPIAKPESRSPVLTSGLKF
jgi:hypothetical protein